VDRELPIYTEQYALVREQATENLPR
jgi:hypothetical protein